ncbi:hypothetical protein [Bosea lupini]|uniref:hypothetical protein n=1 Tax=Bosea lupini TaxID=1036779 RepID=UPI0011601D81|nr:hypothetical protein [Bosea lupini]
MAAHSFEELVGIGLSGFPLGKSSSRAPDPVDSFSEIKEEGLLFKKRRFEHKLKYLESNDSFEFVASDFWDDCSFRVTTKMMAGTLELGDDVRIYLARLTDFQANPRINLISLRGKNIACKYRDNKLVDSECGDYFSLGISFDAPLSSRKLSEAVTKFCKRNSLRQDISGKYVHDNNSDFTFLSTGDFVVQVPNNNTAHGTWKMADGRLLMNLSGFAGAAVGPQLCNLERSLHLMELKGCDFSGRYYHFD